MVFEGTTDIGLGPLQSEDYFDVAVFRLSDDGDPLWMRTDADFAVASAYSPEVAVRPDGGGLLVAEASSPVGVPGGALVASFDRGGSVNWSIHVAPPPGGSVWFPFFPQISSDGSSGALVYLAMGPDDQVASVPHARRFDDAGSLLWEAQDPILGSTRVMDLAGDGEGGVVIAGILFLDGNEGFVARLDARGNPLWWRILSGPSVEECWHVAFDPSGNVIVSGTAAPEATFDGVPLPVDRLNSRFVSKLSPSGDLLWTVRSGPVWPFDRLATNGRGEVLLAGTVRGAFGAGCPEILSGLVRLGPDGDVTGVFDTGVFHSTISAAPDGAWIVAATVDAGETFAGVTAPTSGGEQDLVVARIAF